MTNYDICRLSDESNHMKIKNLLSYDNLFTLTKYVWQLVEVAQ